MPLSKNTPGKNKQHLKRVGRNINGEVASRNVIGAGKKAKESLKKDSTKALVRASATEKLGISRGLGPDSGSGYRKALSTGNIAKKAGLPMNGSFAAAGGSSARKTVNKRIAQSMNARPELKGKYKP
jgi:hypothetical protein